MRTAEQSMQALAAGDEVRLSLAAWKRETAKLSEIDGCRRLADLLVQQDAGTLRRLRIGQALMSVRSIGERKADELLKRAKIVRVDRRLEDLTERQRGELAFLLRFRADRLSR